MADGQQAAADGGVAAVGVRRIERDLAAPTRPRHTSVTATVQAIPWPPSPIAPLITSPEPGMVWLPRSVIGAATARPYPAPTMFLKAMSKALSPPGPLIAPPMVKLLPTCNR